ncbi:MAG: 50S ribosomal protein L24 [Thermoguttaceae bacterium]|nr:50S ribosomal protein L24 [Thermoguttaceae bacterium]
MRIKSNDKVVVRAGKDRGAEGNVTSVDREKELVTVQGVNEVYRHVRRSQRNMQGGRLSKNMPVPAANVMLICPKCSKPTRVGVTVDENGKKRRVCKKCKAIID